MLGQRLDQPNRKGDCSELGRKVIRNGHFESRDDLIAKLLTFITDYDHTAKPFK
jgi:hypothetical protein